MIDFICFILLAIAALEVGIWAGKEVDASIGLEIKELEGGIASLVFCFMDTLLLNKNAKTVGDAWPLCAPCT